ncbi:Cytosolic carboxypeptidase 2 [Cladochytrium tenue]|nr:Cytosolic carboxypeptidase 2 [Cladochytrium tenue]
MPGGRQVASIFYFTRFHLQNRPKESDGIDSAPPTRPQAKPASAGPRRASSASATGRGAGRSTRKSETGGSGPPISDTSGDRSTASVTTAAALAAAGPATPADRAFSLLLSRAAGDLFAFRRCQFRVQRSKAGTGRVAVRTAFAVPDSFTLEASFCGSDTSPLGGFHYAPAHLEAIGEALGSALHDYLCVQGCAEDAVAAIREAENRRDAEFMAEDSCSSDTTSDDEELRLRPKKKRRAQKKAAALAPRRPSTPTAPRLAGATLSAAVANDVLASRTAVSRSPSFSIPSAAAFAAAMPAETIAGTSGLNSSSAPTNMNTVLLEWTVPR